MHHLHLLLLQLAKQQGCCSLSPHLVLIGNRLTVCQSRSRLIFLCPFRSWHFDCVPCAGILVHTFPIAYYTIGFIQNKLFWISAQTGVMFDIPIVISVDSADALTRFQRLF